MKDEGLWMSFTLKAAAATSKCARGIRIYCGGGWSRAKYLASIDSGNIKIGLRSKKRDKLYREQLSSKKFDICLLGMNVR